MTLADVLTISVEVIFMLSVHATDVFVSIDLSCNVGGCFRKSNHWLTHDVIGSEDLKC